MSRPTTMRVAALLAATALTLTGCAESSENEEAAGGSASR